MTCNLHKMDLFVLKIFCMTPRLPHIDSKQFTNYFDYWRVFLVASIYRHVFVVPLLIVLLLCFGRLFRFAVFCLVSIVFVASSGRFLGFMFYCLF